MELIIHKEYHSLSLHAANEISELVKNKPDAIICLAAGNTPRLTYNLVVDKAINEKIDFSRITFIGLDEWVGIPPENEGSCHYFLKINLFDRLNFNSSNIHLFNAISEDLPGECERMDEVIRAKGGIDLMLLGVGMNGHIGFNEPGVSFNNYSHVIDLDSITTSVGQKYFQQATVLRQGITLGLKHLMESKRVLLLANGITKAIIIKRVMEEEVSNLVPASIVRTHPNAAVLVDEEAASMIVK